MMERGYTLIEVVVALLLLSLTAIAVTETLLHAQRAQIISARWMEAVMLAQQTLEQTRLDHSSGSNAVGLFRLSWSSTAADPDLGLRQLDVHVEWDVPTPQHFALVTLARQ